MMATTRQEAIRSISSDANFLMDALADNSATSLPKDFGALVFNDQTQRQRLPGHVYQTLRKTIETGERLDPEIADAVATAMKD